METSNICHRLIHVLARDHQRRNETQRADAARQQEQTVVEGACQDSLAQIGSRLARHRISDQLGTDHQPLAAHIAYAIQLLLQLPQALHEVSAHRGGVGSVLTFDQIERRKRCRTAQRIAPVGVSMGTAFEFLHVPAARHDEPDGQAGTEPLREGHDVRRDAPVLAGKHFAGAADSGLHLIEYQQDAVPVAQVAQSLQKAIRRHQVTALTLNRFDEDRGHFAGRHVSK